MNRNAIEQIIKILQSSSKSSFILELSTEDGNTNFEYTIDRYSIEETIESKVHDMSMRRKLDFNYNLNTLIPDNYKLKVKSLCDRRRHQTGFFSSIEKLTMPSEPSLIIKLARILKENCKILLTDGSRCYVAYYLRNRVYIVNLKDDKYELIETNLFKLYSFIPNLKLEYINAELFTNYSEFIKRHKRKAEIMNKEFIYNKRGGIVNAGVN